MAVIKRTVEGSVDAKQSGVALNNTTVQPLLQNNALSEGLESVGGVIENISNQIDETKTVDAETEYYKRADDILFNSDDAYYGLKGENAFNKTQETTERLEALRKDISSRLTNERQRGLFAEIIQQRQQSDAKGIATFSRREMQAWEVQASKARVTQAINSAKLDNNPESININLDRIQREISSQASKEGWGSDVKGLALTEGRSTLVRGAIDSAIENDDLSKAKGLLRLYDGKLTKDDKDFLDGRIEKSSVAQDALLMADDVRIKGGTRDERLARVDTIKDADRRAATRQLVLADYTQEKLGEAETESKAMDDVEEMILRGDSIALIKKTKAWSAMGKAKQNVINKSLNKGVPRKTDVNKYTEFRAMAADPNVPVVKLKTWLGKNAQFLSAKDFKKFTDETYGDRDDLKPFYGARRQAQVLIKGMNESRQALFMQSFDDWYGTETAARKGEEPSDTEIKSQINSMLKNKDVGFWGTDTPAFVADADEQKSSITRASDIFKELDGSEPDANDQLYLFEYAQDKFKNTGSYPTRKEYRKEIKRVLGITRPDIRGGR